MDYIRDTIDYLINFDSLKNSLDNLKCKIIELQAELKSVKEINYSGMPSGGGNQEPDDKIINIMYCIEKSKEEFKITKKKIENIEKVLDKLPKRDKKVIEAYYIEGLRDESLLKELHCSERQMYIEKKKALRVLAINLYGIKVIG